MSEWREVKISEIAEVIGGGTPSTKNEEYYGGNIPWICPKDLTNHKSVYISHGERNITELGLMKSSAKLMPKNSVLLTSRAPIGYLAIAHNELCTNQGFKSLVVNPEIAEHRFVYYLLKKNVDALKSLGTGTTFAEISGAVVKNFRVKIPHISEQQEIAEILSSLDDKIELNQKINTELEKIAQTIYKQWFVDFEFPDENGNPYKSSGGEMVDSEMGMIPIDWKVVGFNDLATVKYGKDHKKLNDGAFPLYGSGGIMRFVESYLYDKPSILIPRKGTLSNVMRVFEPFWSVDTMFYTIIHQDNHLNYLYYYILGQNLSERNVGSAVPSMTTQIINSVKVILPPNNILTDFENCIREIINLVISNDKENSILSSTRDLLVKKIM